MHAPASKLQARASLVFAYSFLFPIHSLTLACPRGVGKQQRCPQLHFRLIPHPCLYLVSHPILLFSSLPPLVSLSAFLDPDLALSNLLEVRGVCWTR
ncbi:hypothetical protein GUITHDRAFT_155655 [Guillardia theta CCMP2712]|uniref:Secreted protein n=1 Tax=Guillardia theta (strain CCMP2712) TaxID=905079 RepID=L1IEJ3_GUITC|nr:hypothetical protein GUITHDRAFT_155655 [Guillardia theta CCMP2712]EKX34691.1 hypothetical protein GUITHDRAFT_155655 [Guillardia theta CCMP2712]|eukprot:XP_005821671.1 hypothetical protein GUITHDRAFT_155655 [Guillardia theta CCMP2712]